MILWDFFRSDKSKLQMMADENRRLIHEIANLKQREMLRGDGMSEHKLRQTLKQVLAEYHTERDLDSLAHQFDGRNGNGYQPRVSLEERPRPNPDAKKPEIYMSSDCGIREGYQPVERRPLPTEAPKSPPLPPKER